MMNCKRRKTALSLMLLFLFSYLVLFSEQSLASPVKLNSMPNVSVSDLVAHDPISIFGDYNLSIAGWSGSGTESDPYIIENLEIDNTVGNSISITDTTLYFEIRNCLLRGYSYQYSGIRFYNVTNALVDNCTIDDKYYGIYTEITRNCTITNNSFLDCYRSISMTYYSHGNIISHNRFTDARYAIFIERSNNVTLSFNDIHLTYGYGIRCELCDYLVILNNTLDTLSEYDYYGITIDDGYEFVLSNNTVDDSFIGGAYVSYSYEGTISHNYLGRGLRIYGGYYYQSLNLNVIDNRIRNGMVGYFESANSVAINAEDYNQILAINCQNLSIIDYSSSGITFPISLQYCFNCSILSADISDCWNAACELYYSDNCSIISSTLANFTGNGVLNYYSNNVNISGNDISEYHASSGAINVLSSDYVNIEENYIHDGERIGINIRYSNAIISSNDLQCENYADLTMEEAYDCIVTDNDMITGISIQGNDYSSWIHTFSNNLISGKEFGYFRDSQDALIEIDEYYQLVLVNMSRPIITCEDLDASIHSLSMFQCPSFIVDNIQVSDDAFLGSYIYQSPNSLISEIEYVCKAELQIYGCENCTITRSSFNNSMDYGLYIYYSDNTTIDSCILASNQFGLYLAYSVNCTIEDSIFLYNYYYGIYLSYGVEFCQVFGNKIGWNGYNARDYGSNNTWDDGYGLGNFWHDYEGSGVYQISGPAGSVDRFPILLEEFEPSTPTTTITIPTGYTDTDFTPISPFLPPSQTTGSDVWYHQQILGIPLLTLAGGLAGVLSFLMVVILLSKKR